MINSIKHAIEMIWLLFCQIIVLIVAGFMIVLLFAQALVMDLSDAVAERRRKREMRSKK